MVEKEIKYRKNKRGISIYSKSKILSPDFRKWFLSLLSEKYDLYEYLNGEMRTLDITIIEDSSNFSEAEIAEHKRCYVLDKIDGYFSFDEFLDVVKIIFSDIYVFNKGAYVDQNNFKKSKTAIIEMQPDGDVNCVWIEVFHQDFEICLIDMIEKYNCSYT